MTPNSPIRKVYSGIVDRRQMFRLFNRHAQRTDMLHSNRSALFDGEWFEIGRADHDYMLDILPPLWMRSEMFAMREFLTGNVTSVFYTLRIDGKTRFFHAYCDLSNPRSPVEMRDAIVEREFRPVKAMTREERLEHIWSATRDDYRGYACDGWAAEHRGKRTVLVHRVGGSDPRLLEDLTAEDIAERLPEHLRDLPDRIAA